MISQTRNTKRFCSEPLENIENYDLAVADKEHIWHCHHRNEICLANQSRLDKGITSRKQLIADGMYYHRPACELIFLRQDEHRALHAMNRKPETTRQMVETSSRRMRCAKLSEDVRRRISEKKRGQRGKKVEMTRLADASRMVFPSMGEAARWLRENGYPKAHSGFIHKALKNNTYSCGATWRYL